MLALAAEKEKSEQLEARVNILEQEVRTRKQITRNLSTSILRRGGGEIKDGHHGPFSTVVRGLRFIRRASVNSFHG